MRAPVSSGKGFTESQIYFKPSQSAVSCTLDRGIVKGTPTQGTMVMNKTKTAKTIDRFEYVKIINEYESH
jgi:hypothetical protein